MTVLMRTPGYSHPFEKFHNEGKAWTMAWKDEQKLITEKKKRNNFERRPTGQRLNSASNLSSQ